MLSEIYVGSLVLAAAYELSSEKIKNFIVKSSISSKFYDVVKSKNEEGEPKFSIKKIILKEYGFDIDIKTKHSMSIFMNYIQGLEYAFEGSILIQNKRDGILAKVWLNGQNIRIDDKIRFQFDKAFNKVRNDKGETFSIREIKTIENPLKKESVGYLLNVEIPLGLNFNVLDKYIFNLEPLGKVFAKWNSKSNLAEIELITKDSSMVNYSPQEVSPYQMFIGLKQNFEKIILDYKINPNAFITGVPTSGKTTVMIQSILNLLLYNDKSNVRLAIASLGKEDLKIFKESEQCEYYSNTLAETEYVLNNLLKEINYRNKLFAEEDICFNVFDYEDITNIRLPMIHFFCDEVSDLMPTNEKSPDYDIKNRINEKLIDIGRKGRSAGVYLTLATQRGDCNSLNPILKSCLGNKIIFKQQNEKSASLVVGEDKTKIRLATNLNIEDREFLYDTDLGFGIGKSCFLDNNLIRSNIKNISKGNNKSVKDLRKKRFLKLNKSGLVN